MEFLDSLVKLFDGCVGLLEVLTLLLDLTAIYVGVRTYQRHKHVAEKSAHHHAKSHLKTASWWPAVALAVLAIALTALTIWKYARPER
jgi:hypothetical protein